LHSNSPPESHPLDFDWRFTPTTVEEIRGLMLTDVPTIAVGAPSIARRFEQLGQNVLLVDRQPLQGVSNHLVAEIGTSLPNLGHFAQAVIDPPWYPEELQSWVAWTANIVGKNGTIFVSIWPNSVRPTGHSEALSFVKWARSWAELETLSVIPLYEEPPFERLAVKSSPIPILSMSPRQGRLLKLTVVRVPELQIEESNRLREKWIRFVVDEYQLALKLCPLGNVTSPLSMHPEANGWHWPYVSRRAPKRDLIGLWSSDNEVALVQNPDELLEALRAAVMQSSARSFEESLGKFTVLNKWNIPRPPYKRLIEWQHQ
jgi:hypothetical protein